MSFTRSLLDHLPTAIAVVAQTGEIRYRNEAFGSIFGDEAGKMNRDVKEAGGAILAVSQFTLAGSIARGRRPSFDNAEEPARAKALFELFVRELASTRQG